MNQPTPVTETSQRPSVMAQVRARYTTPVLMLDHLEKMRPGRRYAEALRSRAIAARPAGRFGLERTDTTVVLPLLDAVIAVCQVVLAPAAHRAREMVKLQSYDETANDLDDEFPELMPGDAPIEILLKIGA